MFITNENFNDIQDTDIVYNRYLPENSVRVARVGDEIVISTEYPVSNCWYYIKIKDNFILTNRINEIDRFCFDNGLIPQGDMLKIFKYRLYHKSAEVTYKLQYKYIEDFREIRVKADGAYSYTPFGFKSFWKDPKENYDQIKEFLLKYKRTIKQLITDGVFLPTLTGGLDSRTIIGLYRDELGCIESYYLKAVKPDGKNHVEKGMKEIDVAEIVWKRLGVSPTRTESLNGCVTVSGRLNENQRDKNMDFVNTFWVDKVIRHDYNTEKIVKLYTDPLYLELMQTKNIYRCLFALLLIPDLLDIPLVGMSDDYYAEGTYDFYEKYKTEIQEAKAIMEYWGKEKCDNILK